MAKTIVSPAPRKNVSSLDRLRSLLVQAQPHWEAALLLATTGARIVPAENARTRTIDCRRLQAVGS
ncbi:MAG: hypothetical protein JWQ11_2301 [Rhizobacter sp.]|nr:hypothetical protein [Rhizobacter sp.]